MPGKSTYNKLKVGTFLVLTGLLTGCSFNVDPNSDTGLIPGPDPKRTLPADALNPLGPYAKQPDDLWNFVLILATIIGVLVLSGILFIMIRFRDRGETTAPKQIKGNHTIEVIWTIIPAIILIIIGIPTVQQTFWLQEGPSDDAINITVVGKQYWWQFNYPDNGNFFTAGELYIPAGREVYLTLDGTIGQRPKEFEYQIQDSTNTDERATNFADVLHSFWVPSLAGKRDFVPGTVRYLKIQADKPGVYPGNCAEFCGLSHANMRFTVIAVTQEEYDKWLEDMQKEAKPATEPLAMEGQTIFSQQCVGCHTIRGLEANVDSKFGPDLTHFASRYAFAGYIWDTPYHEGASADADELLHAWLKDAPAVKPGSQMPALHLTENEITALMAYLATLE